MNLDSSISIAKKLNIDGKFVALTPINFGRNSRNFKISSNKQDYLLKSFRHHYDGKERFQREKFCLSLGNKLDIQNMPRLITFDEDELQILCEFIVGEHVSMPSLEFEDSIFSFIANLNSNPEFLKYSLNAKDAYLNDFNILNDINLRISKIARTIDETYRDDFHKIVKLFDKLMLNFPINRLLIQEKQFVDKFQPIFSPSDVGIHNSMVKENRFFFFDFEYSGMDSIVKLALDYSSNPQNSQNSVDCRLIERLDQNHLLHKSSNLFEWLLPLRNYFLVKWSLICLTACLKDSNDFDAYANLKSSVNAIEF